MSDPFWVQLLKQWKDKAMGHYGVSFPFLIGAIARQSGSNIKRAYIDDVFKEIINIPIEGCYCEVRWCGDIDEPVISIEPLSTIKKKSIKARFMNERGVVTLAFTSDLMSMFALDCENKEECLSKLVSRTLENTENNLFSKNKGVFGDFTATEIRFIEDINQ